jgi:hypothetical protein
MHIRVVIFFAAADANEPSKWSYPGYTRPLYVLQEINLTWVLMNLNNWNIFTVEYVLPVYSAFGIPDLDDNEV